VWTGKQEASLVNSLPRHDLLFTFYPPALMELKECLAGELKNPWAQSVCKLPKGTVGQTCVGHAEIYVVESVVKFRSELQGHTFFDGRVFEQGKIGIEVSRSTQSVLARIPERPNRIRSKGARLEPLLNQLRMRPPVAQYCALDACHCKVSTIIADAAERIVVLGINRLGKPSLPGRNSTQFPSIGQASNRPVYMSCRRPVVPGEFERLADVFGVAPSSGRSFWYFVTTTSLKSTSILLPSRRFK